MIDIDGSLGEGGGQMLRSSLTLSLLTGKPFHLRKIRARRSKPGLQPQHLMAVRAASTIGSAHVQGASLGSTDLVFEPGKVQPGSYRFAIGTAGATSLVLHTIYLPLALAPAPSDVVIEGGTHVKACPSFHFLEHTWRTYLEILGIDIRVRMPRSGFYPRGGGVLEASVQPTQQVRTLTLDTVTWDRSLTVLCAVAGLPEHIRRRQADRAVAKLAELSLEPEIREENWPGGPGTFLGVSLHTRPVPTLFFALGERGKPAEQVADEAVRQVAEYVAVEPFGVDSHSADQLLLPLALARGESRFRTSAVTLHLLTNADVIMKFLERTIHCEGNEGEPGMVTIAG